MSDPAHRPSLEHIEQRIAQLGVAARDLEPDAAARSSLRREVVEYSERFLGRIDDDPGYVQDEAGGARIRDVPIPERGRPMADLLSLLETEVDTKGINPASGGHLGYIPGGGLYPSSLGDYLAAVTNRYSGIYFANPGAVRIENLLIRWMARLVGYGDGAWGDLSSGGSIANLTGIVTAREASALRARDVERSCIYMTSHVHHCVAKALRIAGLEEARVRRIPMDDRFRLDAAALASRIARDRSEGLNPFLVVCSAGTTDVGAVDPIPEIADVTERERIWLHVDGAYGGFFVLCDEGREIVRGLERADSVVLDPHKGLFLPYGTGALLVRDGAALARAHRYRANYMQDAEEAAARVDEPSPADHSPELTRHFRGLRMWMPLQLFGVAPFRAALAEKIWLARYFWERVQEVDGVEVGPYPELSVAMFRLRDGNDATKALVERLHRDGRAFLSSTEVDGTTWIRAAVLSFRSHRRILDTALEMVRTYTPDVLSRSW